MPSVWRFGWDDARHIGDFEIVGLVEDTKYREATAAADPMFFLPITQTETYADARLASYQNWSMFIDSLQFHVAGDPCAIEPAVRRTLAQIDPNLTILKLTTFGDQVHLHFNGPQLVARLTTLFGLLALLLACLGLYAVTAYMVSCRKNEIGIRIALGAGRPNIVVLMLRSMTLVGIGLVLRIPLALAAGFALRGELYGVESYDPAMIAGAVVALVVPAMVAAIIPARRAAAIDPVRTLGEP